MGLVPLKGSRIGWDPIALEATGSDELPVGAGNWSLAFCKSSACSELRSHLSSPRRHWLKHIDIPKLEWLWPLSAPARFTALLAIKTPEYSGSSGWGSHTWSLQEHGWFCQGCSSLHCWTKTRHLKSNLSLVFFFFPKCWSWTQHCSDRLRSHPIPPPPLSSLFQRFRQCFRVSAGVGSGLWGHSCSFSAADINKSHEHNFPTLVINEPWNVIFSVKPSFQPLAAKWDPQALNL